jgi:hypothetical protein
MALALLAWLRWGWECFTTRDLWRKPTLARIKPGKKAGGPAGEQAGQG